MADLRWALALLIVLAGAPAVRADDEADVRALIAGWYAEMRKGNEARPWTLMAPGGMLLPRECPDQCGPLPRVAKPRDPYSPFYLARRAKKFAHEITRLRVERTLARVDVWERGWDYAWALKKTTQSAASGLFILEKRPGKAWKVLLYESEVRALRPQDQDGPPPDLSPQAP